MRMGFGPRFDDRVRRFLCCLFVGALLLGTVPDDGVVTATLLATAGTQRLRGVGGLLTGIAAGAVIGAGIGYAAVAFLGVSLSLTGAVSLGVAFGGGVGVVTNYLATGEGDGVDETMTVERAPEPATPTPVDLFDTHPDPILYVADEGHGPVVRAANDAYAETFDVPADAVLGAPLAEAVLATDQTDAVVATVEQGDPLDTVVTCQAADGDRSFRLRTAGADEVGYLVYTPLESSD